MLSTTSIATFFSLMAIQRCFTFVEAYEDAHGAEARYYNFEGGFDDEDNGMGIDGRGCHGGAHDNTGRCGLVLW
jgi:hypothetical protein